jgi:hypothetical protein
MSRALLQRPSLVVALTVVGVLTVAVLRGDLRLREVDAAPRPTNGTNAPPVVVRAEKAPTRAKAVVVRGRVFDPRGFLVVGATLGGGPAVGADVARTDVVRTDSLVRTDSDGAFAIDVPPAGVRDLLVRADGLAPTWWRLGEGSPDAVVLQLAAKAPWDEPPADLPPRARRFGEGTLHGSDGKALANAFVRALGSDEWARSDEFGRFRVLLPKSPASLLVHAPGSGETLAGMAGVGEPFACERSEGVVPVPELALGAGHALRGTVRDPRGQPVEGVPIVVRSRRIVRTVVSGVGGTFQLGGLLADGYTVQPFAHRGAVGMATDVALEAPVVAVDVALRAMDEVRLRVLDEQGAPCASLHVASSIAGLRRGVGQTDEQGFVAVPVVGDATTFEVRTAVELAPVSVRSFDAVAATLVVAR